jgi:hypothetical protein
MREDDSDSYEKSFEDERDEVLLREMQGRAIQVDLDWYQGLYEEQQYMEEENRNPSREIHECQALACDCMSEIESIAAESKYEKLTWNQELAYHSLILIPIEIKMVRSTTEYYPRFWEYVCQVLPESEYIEVTKGTISLPSSLAKRIAAFNEDMLNMKANPLEDSKVLMILTIYHGLEEYEVDDEMRKAHKFWNTRIIEGHRSHE